MKAVHLFQFLLVILCLSLTSCQEDDSPKEGPQGEQGPAGEDGEDGNANVIVSDWLFGSERRDTIIDASNINYVKLAAPELSATYLSNSTILVYMNYGPVVPLPYTSHAGGIANTISFIPAPNRIFITRFTHDNSGSVILSSSLRYRYVIIPPSPSGKNAGVDFYAMSYEEVIDYFGLEQ
ncbi:hypothetical protein [Moheibacter sediminis]|uniref:Collagen triple helix repeat-containing protein n=1 Tax=Moheibacter sediminis TaxID=1434700 RepID=A0A1W2A8Y5_9FLAO|nr:hypothetical protein [Moheibacter sediminis]SMC57127.1 hypothetical protein SAMN06296427_10430 [Moheibacter sediminis]